MTTNTFWTILLKILGIWLLLESLTVIPQFFTSLYMALSFDSNSGIGSLITIFLCVIAIYIFVLWLFIYKTAWLIDKLQLDKGFKEDKLDLNIKRSTVLSIAIIVIGGMIIIDSLPTLCKQIFEYYQQSALFIESKTSGWIIFQSAKTLIGYILMTNSHALVRLIDRQKTKHEDVIE